MKTKKKARPTFGEVCCSYLVTMWLLSGAFLVYAAFTFRGNEFSAANVAGYITASVFLLLFFPILVVVLGLYAIFAFWSSGEYFLCAASVGVMAAFYLLRWAVWFVMYGWQRSQIVGGGAGANP